MASKKTPEINASSMADISFLLLIFFLVTTTMDVDSGLQRRLPPMPEENVKQDGPKVNERNIFIVKISRSDKVFAGSKPTDIAFLKDEVIDFIKNPDRSEKENKQIEGFREYPVSKGIISLQNDRGTSYKAYIAVQNELVKAINELRDEFTMAEFQKKYASCTEDQQKIAREAIPSQISEAEPVEVGKK